MPGILDILDASVCVCIGLNLMQVYLRLCGKKKELMLAISRKSNDNGYTISPVIN